MPVEVQMIFNSSMSEEDFFTWLRSRGVSVKDCKTLSGKTHQYSYYGIPCKTKISNGNIKFI